MFLALYHTLLANSQHCNKTVVQMMATLGCDDLHKDNCIFTLYISSRGMLSSYTTLHPHNVSSFYSNIVQYRFSHPLFAFVTQKSNGRTSPCFTLYLLSYPLLSKASTFTDTWPGWFRWNVGIGQYHVFL